MNTLSRRCTHKRKKLPENYSQEYFQKYQFKHESKNYFEIENNEIARRSKHYSSALWNLSALNQLFWLKWMFTYSISSYVCVMDMHRMYIVSFKLQIMLISPELPCLLTFWDTQDGGRFENINFGRATHHICPLGAWRETWLLYWKAGCSLDNTGSCNSSM